MGFCKVVQGLRGGIDLIVVFGPRETGELLDIFVEPRGLARQQDIAVLEHSGLGMQTRRRVRDGSRPGVG
jgi:hypothetical protein